MGVLVELKWSKEIKYYHFLRSKLEHSVQYGRSIAARAYCNLHSLLDLEFLTIV
jgi:hypothetical protein